MVTLPRSIEKWLLCGVLVAGLLPRLYHLRAPLLDNHSFRQTLTAMQSSIYYREGTSLFHPKTMAGRSGVSDLPEFPIYSYLVALLYRAFGFDEIWGRVVSIVFSLAAVFWFYRLTRRFFDEDLSLFASLLFALCPLFIFYSRSFTRQGGMSTFLTVAMLYYFVEFVDTRSTKSMLLAAAAATLGITVHPPSGYVFLPMGCYLFRRDGRSALKQWRLWVLGAIVACLSAAWMCYQAHYLSGGVLSHTFFMRDSKMRDWSSLAYYTQWIDPAFFRSLHRHISDYMLSAWGVFFAAGGLLFLLRDRSAGSRLFLAWLAAACIDAVLDSYPFFICPHEYYYLVFAPPLAFCAALGVYRCCSLSPRFRGVRWFRLAVLGAFSCLFFLPAWRDTRPVFYRVNWNLYAFVMEARDRIPEDALVYTACSGPEALYYTYRYGWWRYRGDLDDARGGEVVRQMEELRAAKGLGYVMVAHAGYPYDNLIADYLASHELLHRLETNEQPVIYYALYRLKER
ncbi:MAG: glycosyltransferase family 39 protein [bacterium]|nr:glycosyltransferase family 39 protein [bacterium]